VNWNKLWYTCNLRNPPFPWLLSDHPAKERVTSRMTIWQSNRPPIYYIWTVSTLWHADLRMDPLFVFLTCFNFWYIIPPLRLSYHTTIKERNQRWQQILLVVCIADKGKMVPLCSIPFQMIERCERLSHLGHTCMLRQMVYVSKPPLQFWLSQLHTYMAWASKSDQELEGPTTN
jgi:hypothetical protein